MQIYYIPRKNKKPEKNNEKAKRKSSRIVKLEEEGDKKEYNIIQMKENVLTADEIYDIKEEIEDIMNKIYKSEKKIQKEKEKKKEKRKKKDKKEQENKKEKPKENNCFKKQFGIDYFIKILNANNLDFIRELDDESFNLLSDVIFQALLKILKSGKNVKNFKDAVTIIKCSKNYKKIEKKKKKFQSSEIDVLLIDEVYTKFSQFEKLVDYSFFDNVEFWKIYIESNLSEDELKILKEKNQREINKKSDIYESYKNNLFKLFSELVDIILKMKMKRTSFLENIKEIGEEYFLDKQLITNFEDKALVQINPK